MNHNGSLSCAKEMALAAKNAGADVVKYQTAMPELVVSRFAQKAEYQKETTGEGESQLEMIRKLHFGFEAHTELKAYCDEIGIMYLSSAFDLPSVDFLQGLDMPYFKIPSGEITNLPYLERVSRTQKPIILSTGMCTIPEIEDAVEVLEQNGAGKITLLHCNTQYPTPFEDANLLAMLELQRVFGFEVGFSDHTQGFVCDVAAVALGAVVIEKHFTLNKSMPGPDHKASLDVAELAEMVKAIRITSAALGSGKKRVTASEAQNKDIARKSIVAGVPIKKGETFSEDNLGAKRPGSGISPMCWYEVLGKTAKRDFAADEPIEL